MSELSGHFDLTTQRPHLGALDGLRGVAILLVMFHHMTLLTARTLPDRILQWVGGVSWCGVDLFFVLSGFLITGILYDTKTSRRYFRQFYARRTLRIFPLYYAVLVAYLIVLPHTRLRELVPAGATPIRPFWYWLYLSNVAMARAHSFGISLLGVTWSLAIEEQFYLVWPIVVLLFDRRTLMVIAALAVVGAPLLRTWLLREGADPIVPYVLTPCRVDSLATGALIALAARSTGGLRQWVSVAYGVMPVALAALIFLLIRQGNPRIDGRPMQMTGYTVLAIGFGAVLVVLAAQKQKGLFTTAPLRMFGRYSYALYLLHPGVIAALRRSPLRPEWFRAWHGSPLPGQAIFYFAGISISLVLALGSWHLWEKHFLKLKGRFPYEPDGPARRPEPAATLNVQPVP